MRLPPLINIPQEVCRGAAGEAHARSARGRINAEHSWILLLLLVLRTWPSFNRSAMC